MIRVPLRARLRPVVPAGEAHGAAAPAGRWSREWLYFTLIAISWCFTPFVRRIIDYRHGAFNPVQITSLIPFVLLLPLVVICFKGDRLARLTPLLRYAAYAWLAAFGYGFLVSAAVGSVGAAAFELIEYLVPMLAGIWLAGQELPAAQALRRVTFIMMPCAAVVAVYGLFQWVSPPPWDVMWVEGADFVSVGTPAPFAMRVFATLNSPGTAGDFFVLTILLMLPFLRLRSLIAWPLVGAIGAALLLTLVREAWVGLIVGALVYLLASPRRLAALPSLGIYVAILLFLVSSLPAMMGSGANSDVVTQRIATFGDIDHDGSALDRQGEFADSFAASMANPIGTGLGTVGAAAKIGTQGSSIGTALDSGYFARLVELGWAGFVLYIVAAIGIPVAFAFQIFLRGGAATVDVKVAVATVLAICGALAWGDAANDAHLGLDGFFFWIALGIGSLALQSTSVPLSVPARGVRLQQVRS